MKTPAWVVPILVVLFAALGVGGARLLAVPSVVKDFPASRATASRTTVLIVEGVKCVDTAERAAGQLQDVAGVVKFTAYASRNRVEVAFDPKVTDPSKIREALEGPVHDAASGEYLFGVFRVVEMDGLEITKP